MWTQPQALEQSDSSPLDHQNHPRPSRDLATADPDRNYLSNYTEHNGTWLDKISNEADRSTSRTPRSPAASHPARCHAAEATRESR